MCFPPVQVSVIFSVKPAILKLELKKTPSFMYTMNPKCSSSCFGIHWDSVGWAMKPLLARSGWTVFEYLVASSREFPPPNLSSMKAKMRIPNEHQCLINTFRTLVNTMGGGGQMRGQKLRQ